MVVRSGEDGRHRRRHLPSESAVVDVDFLDYYLRSRESRAPRGDPDDSTLDCTLPRGLFSLPRGSNLLKYCLSTQALHAKAGRDPNNNAIE